MKFTKTERIAIALMSCLLCFVASAIGVWLFVTLNNSALEDRPESTMEPRVRMEQPAPTATRTAVQEKRQTDISTRTATATKVIPLTVYTPVDTATPTPTVTDTPTLTPTRPSPTATEVSTPTPIIIRVTVIAPPAARPPAVSVPTAPRVDPAAGQRCEESENAYHRSRLATIESTYQLILSQIDRQIESATRQRDARAVLDLQNEKKSYERQKAADINAENARYNSAVAACRR